MAQYFRIHPVSPQLRLIRQAASIINQGGVAVYPTDSSYAIGCSLGNKNAIQRIRKIRKLDNDHNFTLVTKDLSEISVYAKLENDQYRILRANTPGPYTFILPATRQVPRRLQHPKRKTVGLRVPGSEIAQALLTEMGEPIISSTLILPDAELPVSEPERIRDRLEHLVDIIIDGGFCGLEPTTVVAWIEHRPVVIREGKGSTSAFM